MRSRRTILRKMVKKENMVGNVASRYISPHDKGQRKEPDKEPCRPNINGSRGIHLESLGKVADSYSIAVCMGYYYDFVAAVDESLGELVDVRFDSSRLGVEEVGHQPVLSRGPLKGEYVLSSAIDGWLR